MDSYKNKARFQVSAGYNAAATTIVLSADPGSACPTAPANAVYWDYTIYKNPIDDPLMEIVRMTARAGASLTVSRAQEGTTAQDHNIGGHTYMIAFVWTAKAVTDIANDIAAPATNSRYRAGNLELYNSEQATWHPITVQGLAGAEWLQIGPGNNNP